MGWMPNFADRTFSNRFNCFSKRGIWSAIAARHASLAHHPVCHISNLSFKPGIRRESRYLPGFSHFEFEINALQSQFLTVEVALIELSC